MAAEADPVASSPTMLQPGPHQRSGLDADRPLGNLDPGLGADLLHHVHADDVAQAFKLAIEHRDAAAGTRSTSSRRRR
jgi:nucleoside-diphosphate-sugar epimerase